MYLLYLVAFNATSSARKFQHVSGTATFHVRLATFLRSHHSTSASRKHSSFDQRCASPPYQPNITSSLLFRDQTLSSCSPNHTAHDVATIDAHAALTLHPRRTLAIAILLQLLPFESKLAHQWQEFQDSAITWRRRCAVHATQIVEPLLS